MDLNSKWWFLLILFIMSKWQRLTSSS